MGGGGGLIHEKVLLICDWNRIKFPSWTKRKLIFEELEILQFPYDTPVFYTILRPHET